MPTTKQAVIATALVAFWSAAPVMGQTTGMGGTNGPAPSDAGAKDIPGERASAVIRAIESATGPTSAVPVAVPELAQARAAGEMKVRERGEPIQVERIQLDEPVRSRAGAGSPAAARATADKRASAGNADRPQVVRVDGRSTDREKAASVGRLDDAARYREQARYETAKKQRDAAATAATSAQSNPAVRSAQGKAEIAWSAPARDTDRRAVLESEKPTLY